MPEMPSQKKMTLLERAMSEEFDHRRKPRGSSDEELDLVLAFIQRQITVSQFASAMSCARSNAAGMAWTILRHAVNNGMVRLERLEKERGQ